MTRIARYIDSLNRFLREKTSLADPKAPEITQLIYNKTKNSDYILSILFLTIINNQNKKRKISINGYAVATSIELLNTIFYFIEKKQTLEPDKYFKIYNYLINNSNKLLFYNLENIKNIKNSYKSSELLNINFQVLNLITEIHENINNFQDFKTKKSDSPNNNNLDIINWYFKNNSELIQKYKTLEKINKESLMEYINFRYNSICELAILSGWIIGGGDSREIPKLKRISKYFSIIYKLSRDFGSLESDITDNINSNYILNFGIQDAYEQFLIYKEKLIEESMILDIYTDTCKEIINSLEINIDHIIDESSPDLKSNNSK